MECPYCNANMEMGYISSLRDDIKWVEDSKFKGAFISMFRTGIKLTEPYFSNRIEAYVCSSCNKMIIDIPDIMDRKL